MTQILSRTVAAFAAVLLMATSFTAIVSVPQNPAFAATTLPILA